MLKNILKLLGAKFIFFVLAVIYTGALVYVSLINLAETPMQPLVFSDKIMHMGAYFGLVLLWLFYFTFNFKNKDFRKVISVICASAIIFGIFIEVLQDVLTNYRELDIYDIVANSVGALLASILVWHLKESLIRLKANINLFFMKK